jgi:hypothetical protein
VTQGTIEGSAGSVPGEELDIVANPPAPAISIEKMEEAMEIASKTPLTYGQYAEQLSTGQRLVAFGLFGAVVFIVWKSRQASRRRSVLQEKTMA